MTEMTEMTEMMAMADEKMNIWYLYHSGYAVEAGGCLLVFDYYRDIPEGAERGLENGVFDPTYWLTRAVHQSTDGAIPPVIVFSSHKHGDHFNPDILAWQETIPTIRYVLSGDISKRHLLGIPNEDIQDAGNPDNITTAARIMRIKADQTFSWPEINMLVHAFKSTDAGVAFLIDIGGKTIFHAGDLNLWLWAGESKAWNNNMSARYKKEIGKMKDYMAAGEKTLDVGFFPLDPRLESNWLEGYKYFMEHIPVKKMFPMHFGDAFPVLENVKDDLVGKNPMLRDLLILPKRRGEKFIL